MSGTRPALHGDLADWFHLLTAPAEYADEAAVALGLLREAGFEPSVTRDQWDRHLFVARRPAPEGG